jgi:dipicolinate synthase subunit A
VTADGAVRWDQLVIAVVGGDEREPVIARLAAETGATVRAYGFPWPEGGVPGVELAKSAEEAVEGADLLLFPVPGLHADGSLFAEGADEPIFPSEELLSRLADGARIYGTADDGVRAAAAKLGIPIDDYPSDDELMRLRAPAIVEGAISIAIENTVRTLHASPVAVIGFGNIGRQLAQTLFALRSKVHVLARNPAQRAAAYALGAHPAPLDELAEIASEAVVIFSSVPAPVVDRAVLGRVQKDALVVDVAAPPGSVDWDAARELGVKAIWARGLGKRAPVTVGESQWYGIRRRIEAFEAGRAGR